MDDENKEGDVGCTAFEAGGDGGNYTETDRGCRLTTQEPRCSPQRRRLFRTRPVHHHSFPSAQGSSFWPSSSLFQTANVMHGEFIRRTITPCVLQMSSVAPVESDSSRRGERGIGEELVASISVHIDQERNFHQRLATVVEPYSARSLSLGRINNTKSGIQSPLDHVFIVQLPLPQRIEYSISDILG